MNTYFMQKPRLFAASLGAMALALLPSCQDEDFGYTAEQIKYAKIFTEKYGEIPSDKSWDLSSSANAYNPSFTRASGGLGNGSDNQDLTMDTHYALKDWWEVPSQTLEWLEKNLIEKKDNRWLGSNFVLKINPNSDFAIVPIYQGSSAINSSLSIKINGYNIKEICPRSKNIQAKRTDTSDWEDLGYYDGWKSTSFDDFVKFKNNESGYVLHPSYTDKDYAVRAKPLYFRASSLTNLQNDGFMYLDLINDDKMFVDVNDASKKWDSDNTWTKIGDHLTSINPKGQMVAFNLPWDGRPEASQLPDIHEGIDENHKMPSQVLIIGCEDAHGVESDYDVNDVVYMIIGYPYAPEIVPTTQLIKKRYMCEDLGATDDFDFNDIVIDVNQSMEYQLITNPEGKAEDYEYDGNLQVYMQAKPETKKQWARISHVCGTLPFQVKVGDYYFHKVTDPTDDYKTRNELAQSATTTRGIDIAETDGWNPNETKEITGWDPKANNVTIYVEWKGGRKADDSEHTSMEYNPNSEEDRYADFANGECKVVKFPKDGDVPYIIAVDQDIPWMKERVSIPDSWVTGNLVSREGAAGPGSSAQYLDYGNDADGHTNEAVIWTGDVYGKQYSTGLDLGSDESSATYNGLKEAIGKSFNILAVYTTTPGSFGLMCDNNGWELLTNKDADAYIVSTEKVGDLYCTKIMLTGDQLAKIQSKGLIVQNRTNGMHIQKVSMMRNNPDRNGFSVRFDRITGGQGSITTANYQRYRDDDGDSVPFEDACFANGSSVEFTATANEGYKFTGWTIAGTDVTITSSTDNPITVSKDIIKGWGISNGIVRLAANFSANSLCKVGAHIQVGDTDNNAPGKMQLTTPGTFRDSEGNPLSTAKEVTIANGEYVYVYNGTTVTFKAPINADYKIAQQEDARYFDLETMTRTSVVNAEEYTPYVKYTEKAPAGLQLSDARQANITLNASTTGVDVAWTTSSNGAISCETPDYINQVNIWRNGDQNSHHIRAQKQNGTFVVKIKQAATDTYKSAEISINVTIENYWDNDNNAQIIPGTLYQSGDYQVYTCDISKMKSALPANCTTVKMYVKRTGTGATSWIVSNGASSDEWYKLAYWGNNWLDDTSDSQFKWNNKQYSFTITMSKTDWDNIIGNHSFIMKSNVDLKYTVSIKGE